ncbi:PA14 domain-containing protein [Aquibacillus kalidii]|uniref:PA14 domain-containing protein n=1 Tax=Aquibacillus kalidii TaxID=2762597 RepID=UPI0016456953|nr:PA14 domain-containing protein [Aquibacillus kalidii]
MPNLSKAATSTWSGELFSNLTFSGISSPMQIETSNLEIDWGNQSPAANIKADGFTARFQRDLVIEKDKFMSFKAWADDGIRVYVDNQLIIDSWKNDSYGLRGENVMFLSQGTHTVKVEYYDNVRRAAFRVDIGEKAAYKETTEQVHYHWGYESPTGFPVDNFYAYFDQSRNFDGQEYFLQTLADDGIRVKVNGEYKVDRWTNSSGQVNRTILGKLSGHVSVGTEYYDGVRNATIYSDIVPFGHWLGYYYNNDKLEGRPIKAQTLQQGERDSLSEDNGKGSPLSGINSDKFSSEYITAKRLSSGYYILRVGADDGVRVYLDGKKVVDRWSVGSYKEESFKINVKDINGSNIHWIKVEYRENTGSSKLAFNLKPVEVTADKWTAEFYPNTSLSGDPEFAEYHSENLSLDWGNSKPVVNIPEDKFSAKFQKLLVLDNSKFVNFKAFADDGIRVYVDDQLIIDSWINNSYSHRGESLQYLSKGTHRIKVEYYDNVRRAAFDVQIDEKPTYSEVTEQVHYQWGYNGPKGFPVDDFYAYFDQSRTFDGQEYFLQTLADDGIRVKVNGKYKVDRWTNSSGKVNRAILGTLSGNVTIGTEYYDGVRNSTVYSDVVPFGSWLAYYYNNDKLEGNPENAKIIAPGANGALLEDSGSGSPITGIQNDYYSSKYVTAKRITAGAYTLNLSGDDGVRVYLDGKLVVDRWTGGSFKDKVYKVNVNNVNGSNIHWIEVEHREDTGLSNISLSLEPLTIPVNGWIGELYSNKNLSGTPLLTGYPVAYEQIDFQWGDSSPEVTIPADGFSGRYQGKVNITEDGDYTMKVWADDGAKLYVDGKLVINAWSNGSLRLTQNNVTLTKGTHTVVIEYYENTGSASLKFDFEKYNPGPTKIYTQTQYNYSFDQMVDRQMNYGGPKADGAGTIPATRELVEYYANPSNFKKGTESYLQFLLLSKPAGLNVDEVNSKILYNKGIFIGKAQAFINAAKKYSINEVYLMAHALHETGNGSSTLAKGVSQWNQCSDKGTIVKDSNGNPVKVDISPNKVYNMYGIGAYDDYPTECGAQKALKEGWTSPEAAIIGGAQFVSVNYIQAGQNTLYKMKWNPSNPGTHQYATHVSWAVSQTSRIQSIYNLISNYTMQFDEPKFLAQPGETELPSNTTISSYPDGTIGFTTSSVNFRSKPSVDSTTLIKTLNTNQKVVVYGRNSDGWYKVKVDNQEGWLYSPYVELKNLYQVSVSSDSYLNLREQPNSDSSTLANLSNNQLLTALLDSNNNVMMSGSWLKVTYSGKTGWVHVDYVNQIK